MEINNDEKRRFLIHCESLRLHDKVYQYQKHTGDSANDRDIILNEIAAGLLKINEWNNETIKCDERPNTFFQWTFGGGVTFNAMDTSKTE